VEFDAIGHVRSPYRQKFGVPRQSGLAAGVESSIELSTHIAAESLSGLDLSTHIWVIFVFHEVPQGPRKATVRPPRLGGNAKMGSLASRSPYRPNPLGLSVVRLVRVEDRRVVIDGGDFVDGTPVLDIKPYVPYADAPTEARCSWASSPPEPLGVRFSPAAEAFLRSRKDGEHIRAVVHASLCWDPRPPYEADARPHGVRILDLDVRFTVRGALLEIESFAEIL
jgi:tRNA-Thr(GGU) m(6)t(6)A37 methyltransferase TsaA